MTSTVIAEARARRRNPWELYESVAGWEVVARRLDAAVQPALGALDAAVADGATPTAAATAAYARFCADVLEKPGNEGYGAADTESRGHLIRLLREHLRVQYGVSGWWEA